MRGRIRLLIPGILLALLLCSAASAERLEVDFGVMGFGGVEAAKGWNPALYTMPDPDSRQLPSDPGETDDLRFFASGWEGDWLRVLRCGVKPAIGYVHRSETGNAAVPERNAGFLGIAAELPEENGLFMDLFDPEQEAVRLEEGHKVVFLARDVCWDNTRPYPYYRSWSSDYVETVMDGRIVRGWLEYSLDDAPWDRVWPAGCYLSGDESLQYCFGEGRGQNLTVSHTGEGVSDWLWYTQISDDMIMMARRDPADACGAEDFRCYTWRVSPDGRSVVLTDTGTGETKTLYADDSETEAD